MLKTNAYAQFKITLKINSQIIGACK